MGNFHAVPLLCRVDEVHSFRGIAPLNPTQNLGPAGYTASRREILGLQEALHQDIGAGREQCDLRNDRHRTTHDFRPDVHREAFQNPHSNDGFNRIVVLNVGKDMTEFTGNFPEVLLQYPCFRGERQRA